MDEDFEVAQSVPLSVRASDDDGQIVDVEFFVDSEFYRKSLYQRNIMGLFNRMDPFDHRSIYCVC